MRSGLSAETAKVVVCAHEVPHISIIPSDLETILLHQCFVLCGATAWKCRDRIGVTNMEYVPEVTPCALQDTPRLGDCELTVRGLLPQCALELKPRDCRDGEVEAVLHTRFTSGHPPDGIASAFIDEAFDDGACV